MSTDSWPSKTSSNSGDQTISMNHIKLPFEQQNTRETLRIFLRETCGGHADVSGSYLRIRDLGEHGGQALRQQHCSPAPRQELRWTYRLIPNHSLPLFLPAATLPPLSLFLCLFLSSSFPLSACLPALAPYTGQDHNGPGWLMVTLVLTVSSHPQLSAALLPYLLPLSHNTAGTQRHADGHHCRQLKTAPLQWREPGCC